MKIKVLNNLGAAISGILVQAKNFAQIEYFDSTDELLVPEDGDGVTIVMLDLDHHKKATEKALKAIRKVDPELPIVLITNDMDAMQMQKHQSSKLGGDLYLKTPVSDSFLKSIFQQFYDAADIFESQVATSSAKSEVPPNEKHQQSTSVTVTKEMGVAVLKNEPQLEDDLSLGNLEDLNAIELDDNIDEHSLEESKMSYDEGTGVDIGHLDLSADVENLDSNLDEDISFSLSLPEVSGQDLSDLDGAELNLSDESSFALDLSQETQENLDLSVNLTQEVGLVSEEIGEIDLSSDSSAELELGVESLEDISTDLDLSLESHSDPSMEMEPKLMEDLDLSENLDLSIDTSLEMAKETTSDEAIDFMVSNSVDGTSNLSSGDIISSSDLDLGDDDTGIDQSEVLDEISMSSDALEKLKEIEEMMGEGDIIGAIDPVLPEVPDGYAKTLTQNIFSGQNQDAETFAQDSVEERQINRHLNDELERLGETIKALRDDREVLLAKLSVFENTKHSENGQLLELRSELDEKKIELAVMRKRYDSQIEEYRYQVNLAREKQQVYEQKLKNLEDDNKNQEKQVKIDINKVRTREKELESKLELLKADAQTQIRNRDQMILELKRHLDTLEFDIENLYIKEKQYKQEKILQDEKMHKVVGSLKRIVSDLEDDGNIHEMIELIKKNLDV